MNQTADDSLHAFVWCDSQGHHKMLNTNRAGESHKCKMGMAPREG